MWSHQSETRSPGRRGESGETLIEVLLTVILMGIVVTAVLTSLFVLVRTAGLNKERTRVSVGVQAVTERLKQPVGDMGYEPCGSVAHYQALVDQFFATDIDAGVQDFVVEVKSVEYATGSNSGSTLGNFGSGCATHLDDNNTTRDEGTQRIVVEVSSAAGVPFASSDEVTLIKRDARCPDASFGYQNPDAGPC